MNPFCDIQLPIYNMAQAQSPHPSLHNYNFVYGQDQIPQVFVWLGPHTALKFVFTVLILHVLSKN